MEESLQMLDKARAEGLDIWADSGMYVDWATTIGSECFRESYVFAHKDLLPDLLVATGKYAGQRLNDRLYHEMRAHLPKETVIRITGAGCVHPDCLHAALHHAFLRHRALQPRRGASADRRARSLRSSVWFARRPT